MRRSVLLGAREQGEASLRAHRQRRRRPRRLQALVFVAVGAFAGRPLEASLPRVAYRLRLGRLDRSSRNRNPGYTSTS